MRAIYEKELKSYFRCMMGYVYLAFFTAAIGIYYSYYCVLNATMNFASYVLQNVTTLFLIGIPILTMKLMSEEKKEKTDQLLLTAPVQTWEIIVGKYLAALSVFAISLVMIAIFPLISSLFGKIDWPVTATGFLGTFLLGAALIAIGMLISCTTEHQMIAAVLGFAVFLLLYMMPQLTDMFPSNALFTVIVLIGGSFSIGWLFYSETKDKIITLVSVLLPIVIILGLYVWKAEIFDNGVANFISWLSPLDRFSDFISGVLNASSVVYYISFIVVSLFIGTQIVEKRRWK
jgi:ABC-2 type transport system permease protein